MCRRCGSMHGYVSQNTWMTGRGLLKGEEKEGRIGDGPITKAVGDREGSPA
jgi:hypothetical protein